MVPRSSVGLGLLIFDILILGPGWGGDGLKSFLVGTNGHIFCVDVLYLFPLPRPTWLLPPRPPPGRLPPPPPGPPPEFKEEEEVA